MKLTAFPAVSIITWVVLSGMTVSPSALALSEGVTQGLRRLRSGDPFERQRGEVALLELGPESLPELGQELSTKAQEVRFRLEKIFSKILSARLAELENEQQALELDRNEYNLLEERKKVSDLQEGLHVKLQEWKKSDPEAEEKLQSLIHLARLEMRKKNAVSGDGVPLGEAAERVLDDLRAEKKKWLEEDPKLDEMAQPFVELWGRPGLGPDDPALSELERIRMKDLQERVAEREPRLATLESEISKIGLPAINGLLTRRLGASERLRGYYDKLVESALGSLRDGLLPEESAFDTQRYTLGLLWAREVDTKGPLAKEAARLTARHLSSTLRDRNDPDHLVRERAIDELYLLEERGLEALRGAMTGGDGNPAPKKASTPLPENAAGEDSFLYGLLRWRVRPRTYALYGIDFTDFETLSFRKKRRKIFDYARVGQKDAIATLRAIVRDDNLEKSFFVKLAAAKALAGLRDMSGFNVLIVKNPEMTLKKPEVSREILIIQGLEHVRDKNYQLAIEELQKVLDEYPFDFRGNYWIAFAYLLLKNYPKSIHHFEIARRINPKDQLTLYNLACAYALSGDKGVEAVEALEASVEAGFEDYAHMEKDPDLESLRDLPGYQQLIEQLKSR